MGELLEVLVFTTMFTVIALLILRIYRRREKASTVIRPLTSPAEDPSYVEAQDRFTPNLIHERALDDEVTLAWLKAHNSFHRGPGEDVKESLAVRSGREYRARLLIEKEERLQREARAAEAQVLHDARVREVEAREAEALALHELELRHWRSMTKDQQTEVWLSERTRPAPQIMGVSARGAEYLAGLWLTYLGEEDVTVTQASGDGGVDVVTRNYCCQVKLYTKQPVSASEIRDLFGTATAMGLRALLMTSSYITHDAEQFALANGVVAIQFNAENATLASLNALGQDFLNAGHYEF